MMSKDTLLKDIVLEKHKTIGEFYRKNKNHPFMPTRDKLYRLMERDIRDTRIRDIYAITVMLNVVKQMPGLIYLAFKSEEDYIDA
jgi:hypothetical protein